MKKIEIAQRHLRLPAPFNLLSHTCTSETEAIGKYYQAEIECSLKKVKASMKSINGTDIFEREV